MANRLQVNRRRGYGARPSSFAPRIDGNTRDGDRERPIIIEDDPVDRPTQMATSRTQPNASHSASPEDAASALQRLPALPPPVGFEATQPDSERGPGAPRLIERVNEPRFVVGRLLYQGQNLPLMAVVTTWQGKERLRLWLLAPIDDELFWVQPHNKLIVVHPDFRGDSCCSKLSCINIEKAIDRWMWSWGSVAQLLPRIRYHGFFGDNGELLRFDKQEPIFKNGILKPFFNDGTIKED